MTEVLVNKKKYNVSEWYIKNFELLNQQFNGSLPIDIKQIRKESFDQLIEIGFPTVKVEDWKYTNVLPIVNKNFKLSNFSETWIDKNTIEKAKRVLILDKIVANLSSNQIVFIDGHFIEELSNVQNSNNLKLLPLSLAFKDVSEIVNQHFNKYSQIENGFNALNTSFFVDGYFLHVGDNLTEDEPIVAIFIQSSTEEQMINVRNLVHVGNNSNVKVLEVFLSLNDSEDFTNSITEINVSENSFAEHYKFQNESLKSYHIGKVQSNLARNSNFTSHNITFGGALTRNDVNFVLNGEGSEAHIYGLFFVKDHQHVDNHTMVDHAMPHCLSNEFYKGILAENSRGVFNGKIIVRKGAQKTNAYQSNKNLLLSGNAKIDTKPQLEIFADDVRCTHGATVGQVDDESLFYLRSRGIDEKSARSLLVNAFANDVLMNMSFEPLRDKINDFVINQMDQILDKK